ncbi:type II toxin-antitoxin system YoeB family toxin [Geobacter pelophilus]|uniref:Type II toxin-antitoxin system YoeB family toxin n=1 Tax=Geoanaerobacter pelophilus TaxID=60036 RepID=A0AAW4L5G5_9BACT|nr:type II toxin-antitoxin system YoeB family toxin [Geoanaerobacter pelophilus]
MISRSIKNRAELSIVPGPWSRRLTQKHRIVYLSS